MIRKGKFGTFLERIFKGYNLELNQHLICYYQLFATILVESRNVTFCHHFGGIEKRKRESGRTFRSKPLTKEFKQSAEGTFIEILSSLESARFRSIGFDDLFELADKSNQEAMC